jgi:type IX secretion system PorP/SprF family membrane protein
MRIVIAIIVAMLSLPALAQQDPLYSQYMLNPFQINPAYAGLNNNFNAMAGYRTQWTGLEGQPTTTTVSGHSSVASNKVGVGLVFINDRIGNLSNTETNLAVSYKLAFKESTFSFGMQAGLQSFRADNSQIKLIDSDDLAFADNERGSRLNIGAGAILKSERFFIGLSIPRLLPSTFSNGGQNFTLYNQHYYLMAGYVQYLTEHVRLKSSVLLRGVKGAPPSVDLAFNLNINAIHTAGVFTRTFNTYGILLQTLIKEKLRFGYVFELPTNKSVGTRFTSHEISVGLELSVLSAHEKSLSNF